MTQVGRMFLQSYGWLGGPREDVYLMHYLEIEHKFGTMHSLYKYRILPKEFISLVLFFACIGFATPLGPKCPRVWTLYSNV